MLVWRKWRYLCGNYVFFLQLYQFEDKKKQENKAKKNLFYRIFNEICIIFWLATCLLRDRRENFHEATNTTVLTRIFLARTCGKLDVFLLKPGLILWILRSSFFTWSFFSSLITIFSNIVHVQNFILLFLAKNSNVIREFCWW